MLVPSDHRDHLVVGVPAAHPFAPHAAVRRYDEPFGGNVSQRFTNQGGNVVWTLHLKIAMVENADDDLLVCNNVTNGLEVPGSRGRRLKGERIGFDAD